MQASMRAQAGIVLPHGSFPLQMRSFMKAKFSSHFSRLSKT